MKKLAANDFTNSLLVEQCESIDINELIREFTNQYKQDFVKAKLAIDNIPVQLTSTETRFAGERLWFLCPICHSRISKLYRTPIGGKVGCRECLNLEYACRRSSGV